MGLDLEIVLVPQCKKTKDCERSGRQTCESFTGYPYIHDLALEDLARQEMEDLICYSCAHPFRCHTYLAVARETKPTTRPWRIDPRTGAFTQEYD